MYIRTSDNIYEAIVVNRHFAAYNDENGKLRVISRKNIKISKNVEDLCDYFTVCNLMDIWWKSRASTFKEALNHMRKNNYDCKYIKGFISTKQGDKLVTQGTSDGKQLLVKN